MFKKTKLKKHTNINSDDVNKDINNNDNELEKDKRIKREREKDLKSFIEPVELLEDDDPVIIINEDKHKKKVEENNNIENEEKDAAKFDSKNLKTKSRGIQIQVPEIIKQQSAPKQEDISTIKKVFLSEAILQQAKTPEELKILLGINREDIEKLKEMIRSEIIDKQKDLFSLPKNLKPVENSIEDHVDNLIRLAAAGMIEVPLPLEQKLKNVEETEKLKKHIMDNKLAEEIDYLKVLKKLGPSYAKGYKSDISHRKAAQLNHVFENVFDNPNSRKRKLNRERQMNENKQNEDNY